MKGLCSFHHALILAYLILVMSLTSGFVPEVDTSHRNIRLDAQPQDASLQQAILFRKATKRFKRYDGAETSDAASASDPVVVNQASQALDLARLSPSSFNTQPYRLVLVESIEQKQGLAEACLGPNSQRVLDSDCTAVFLADKQVTRTLSRYRELLRRNNKKPPQKISFRLQFYITLFSSGYPLPRVLAAPFGFCVRAGVAVVHWFSRLVRFPLPSLGSAETWSARQTMLVAMTYMLACASRGIDTIPMEGFNAMSVRRVVGASGRYSVPVLVATGIAHKSTPTLTQQERLVQERYPRDEVIFRNKLGDQ